MNLRTSGLIAALCLSATMIQAEEWPGWRGPRGDGTSAETGIADAWGPKENVRWKTPIPGVGHSSPIVWGDRIFLTTCVNEGQNLGDRKVLCLDRVSGAILWDNVVVKAKLEHKHNLNSYASGTPATDGKHVYVAFLDYAEHGRGLLRLRRQGDLAEVAGQAPLHARILHVAGPL